MQLLVRFFLIAMCFIWFINSVCEIHSDRIYLIRVINYFAKVEFVYDNGNNEAYAGSTVYY